VQNAAGNALPQMTMGAVARRREIGRRASPEGAAADDPPAREGADHERPG